MFYLASLCQLEQLASSLPELSGFKLFFWRKRKPEKEKEENIWRRSLQKVSKILRSLGFSLGLETFANFWRVSVLVSENLVSGKKSRFWFRKIWSQKKIMGFGYREFGLEKRISFGKFGIEKKSFALEKFGIGRKVSVLVSVKILVSSFSGSLVSQLFAFDLTF